MVVGICIVIGMFGVVVIMIASLWMVVLLSFSGMAVVITVTVLMGVFVQMGVFKVSVPVAMAV